MKKFCKHGHELNEKTLYVNPNTRQKGCRTCKEISKKKSRAPITKWDGLNREPGNKGKKWSELG